MGYMGILLEYTPKARFYLRGTIGVLLLLVSLYASLGDVRRKSFPISCKIKLSRSSALKCSFQNRGPQYRPQNTTIVFIGSPKSGIPELGKLPNHACHYAPHIVSLGFLLQIMEEHLRNSLAYPTGA